MSFENVEMEVLRNSKEKVKVTLAQAEKKRAEILDIATAKVEKRFQEIEVETEKLIASYKEHTAVEIKSELSRAKLNVEIEMTEKLFTEVLSTLSKKSSENRKKYLKTILANAKSAIKYTEVYCAAKDKDLLKSHKPHVAHIKGGLLLATGKTRVDLSYESILQDIRTHAMGDIAKILFG